MTDTVGLLSPAGLVAVIERVFDWFISKGTETVKAPPPLADAVAAEAPPATVSVEPAVVDPESERVGWLV